MSEARRGRSSLAAPSWQWLLLTPHPIGQNRARAEVRGLLSTRVVGDPQGPAGTTKGRGRCQPRPRLTKGRPLT
jgi:hypothetical protein